MNAVYLKITSWVGISLGAEHYYGTLCADGKRIELEKEINAFEARYLNQKDRCLGPTWKSGDIIQRFKSKAELVALARATWQSHFPSADMLILGNPAYAEPQTVLEGPEKLRKKINALANEARRIGYWEQDPNRMRDICQEWDILMGR